jgi:predicted ATPase
LPLTERGQDLARLRQVHLALGNSLYHLGEFAAAQTHFERVVALVDPPTARSRPAPALADPRVVCLSHVGKVLWLFGYPDQALERSNAALALAEETGHPHTRAVMAGLTAWFHMLRGEAPAAQQWAERAGALCREGEFRLWLAQSHVVRGWALAHQGQEEGIAELREGMQAWRATGAVLARPMHLGLLAESCGRVGRRDEGLALLGEALTAIEKTGERWEEAEVYRIKGELLGMSAEDDCAEAEGCFRRALEVARRQQARSLELRATTSMARLWHRRGQGPAARQLLGDTYQWFSEGFDTPDLRDARAVLAGLA